MIDQDLIRRSGEVFDTAEKWNAFLEMRKLSDGMIRQWFESATLQVRDSVAEALPEVWAMVPWTDDFDCGTYWHLKEYEKASLVVGFNWVYEFHLYYNVAVAGSEVSARRISELLSESRYALIRACFGGDHLPNKGEWDMAVEIRRFYFGSRHDGCIPEEELAWYAGHQTSAFVKQATAKVKRITHDSEITRLLGELQREAHSMTAETTM